MNPTAELDFCLLIPCYNNKEGLLRSLESVQYTPNRHLILVVDDGSETALTIEMLTLMSHSLPIHLLRLQINSGITAALNAGLEWIQKNISTKYIARLDCDDRCDATRFYAQVQFLDNNPDVGLLGSWCRFRDDATGNSYAFKAPLDDAAIRKAMHFRNVFIHPTVMFRTEVTKRAGLYPNHFPHAEDYGFFWSILQISKGAILDKFLVTCAIRSSGISSQNRKAQLESCAKVISGFGNQPILKVAGLLITKIRGAIPQKVIFLLKRGWSSIIYNNNSKFVK
ncbi:MAG: hypothetical protein JWP69_543 [Flaviaesturariibacter sp.]|nr:hypothetical protein [Flaviaesturariibacter sp.]